MTLLECPDQFDPATRDPVDTAIAACFGGAVFMGSCDINLEIIRYRSASIADGIDHPLYAGKRARSRLI